MAAKIPLGSIQAVTTLEDLHQWVTRVRAHGHQSPQADEAEVFVTHVSSLRKALSPNKHPSVTEAVQAAAAIATKGDRSSSSALLDFNAALRAVPGHDLYVRLFMELDPLVSDARMHLPTAGGPSRRARNVKAVVDSELFTAHAGKLTLDPSVARDRFGNAVDDRFLLARDGCCAGAKALVLNLYNGQADKPPWPREWHAKFCKKLTEKGLDVSVVSKGRWLDWPMTAEHLKARLLNVSQLWVISDSTRTLTDDHIAVIVAAWEEGMGLYIAGDNEPYFADANPLLAALRLPTMSGNWGGRGVLIEDEGRGALRAHPVSTGIAGGLFEGVTVAHFDTEGRPWPVPGKGIAVVDGEAQDDFGDRVGLSYTVLAYTTQAVTPRRAGIIVHNGSRNKGRVIADGAFTRLFVDWDKHGTSQFVGNCAPFLLSHSGEDFGAGAAAAVDFDYSGNLDLPCSLFFEHGRPFLMLYGEVDETTGLCKPYSLVDDASLNDPVAAGLKLGAGAIGTDVLCGDALAAYVRDNGCPFTRRPVLATLPLVSLEHAHNRRLMAHILTAAFMDSKFVRAAWLVFFGICIRAQERAGASGAGAGGCAGAGAGAGGSTSCPFQWLLENMLQHVTMSPMFASVEPYVPLQKAIIAFAQPSGTNPFLRVRKSLATILALGKFVPSKALVAGWVRNRMLLTAVQRELAVVKGAASIDAYHRACNQALFECNFGLVPVQGTGRLPPAHDLDAVLKLVVQVTLRGKTAQDISVSAEDFITRELRRSSVLKDAWWSLAADNVTFATDIGLDTLLDREFTRFHKTSMVAIPPFVTVLGPSVLEAADGTKFYDGPLSSAMLHAEEIRAARDQYMRSTFADKRHDKGSSNYPLHWFVRRVMLQAEFRDDVEFKPQHALAVVDLLYRQAKDKNIYTPDFAEVVEWCIKSFLKERCANRFGNEADDALKESARRVPFEDLLAAEVHKRCRVLAGGFTGYPLPAPYVPSAPYVVPGADAVAGAGASDTVTTVSGIAASGAGAGASDAVAVSSVAAVSGIAASGAGAGAGTGTGVSAAGTVAAPTTAARFKGTSTCFTQ